MRPVRSVQIIQSYVPEYRRPLFEKLRARLAESGVTLTLVTASPSRLEKLRHDEAILDFQTKVHGMSLTVLKRSLRWKGVWRETKDADLIVCELGSLVLENYPLALWRGNRLATWGHGYAATTKPNRLDRVLEKFLMRRSRLFFSYTEQGRLQAHENGIPDARVVVLRNTVDTTGLQAAVDHVREDPALRTVGTWDLRSDDLVCAYVGALDQSKRLDFLLAAAERIHDEIPTFKLLIAGDGPENGFVRQMVNERRYVRYLGRIGDLEKAQIATHAKLILNPGRVGLVAVDSFVMGLPIITTRWHSHAPEFDYLSDGVNALVVEDSIHEYARVVVDLLHNKDRLSDLVDGCHVSASELSMEALVERFSAGILGALGDVVTETARE